MLQTGRDLNRFVSDVLDDFQIPASTTSAVVLLKSKVLYALSFPAVSTLDHRWFSEGFKAIIKRAEFR